MDIEDVDHVMWDPSTLFHRQLCSADIHPSIELHRICIDDFGIDLTRESDSKVALPRRCRPSDHEEAT
jgi:hypothetical protein